jgi:hypothetical protein
MGYQRARFSTPPKRRVAVESAPNERFHPDHSRKYHIRKGAHSEKDLRLLWDEYVCNNKNQAGAWLSGSDPKGSDREHDRYADIVRAAEHLERQRAMMEAEVVQATKALDAMISLHKKRKPRRQKDIDVVVGVARRVLGRRTIRKAWKDVDTPVRPRNTNIIMADPCGPYQDSDILKSPWTLYGTEFYVGHRGGDYIFRWDNKIDMLVEDNDPDRFLFQGLVPRPHSEYFRRLFDVVIPDILAMIVSALAFNPANGSVMPAELGRFLHDAGRLRREDILLLGHAWRAKFYDPQADRIEVPTFMKKEMTRIDGRVAEAGWLLRKLPNLTRRGQLGFLFWILSASTDLSIHEMAKLHETKLEREGKNILFEEKEYNGSVLVYSHPSHMVSEISNFFPLYFPLLSGGFDCLLNAVI